jgi:hypothetical protein
VGRIPILDSFLLKNPIYLWAAKYKLIDATFPIARFAEKCMEERYLNNEKPTNETV